MLRFIAALIGLMVGITGLAVGAARVTGNGYACILVRGTTAVDVPRGQSMAFLQGDARLLSSPDGEHLAALIHPLGGGNHLLIEGRLLAENVFSVNWSPDSRYFAFLSTTLDETVSLFLADRFGSIIDEQTAGGVSTTVEMLGFSADGGYLAYAVQRRGETVQYRFVRTPAADRAVARPVGDGWSPTAPAYLRVAANPSRLIVISPDSPQGVGITLEQDFANLQITWSPDGLKAAVIYLNQPERGETMPIARLVVLSTDQVYTEHPIDIHRTARELPRVVWAEDSQSLLTWHRRDDNRHELARFSLVEGELETIMSRLHSFGVFSPDDRYAVVQRQERRAVELVDLGTEQVTTLIAGLDQAINLSDSVFWSPDASGLIVRHADSFVWAGTDGSDPQSISNRLLSVTWVGSAAFYLSYSRDGSLQAGRIGFPSLAHQPLLEEMRTIYPIEHPANAAPFDWASLYRRPYQPGQHTVYGFYWQQQDGDIGYTLYGEHGEMVYEGTPAGMLAIAAQFPPLSQPAPDNRHLILTSGDRRRGVHLLRLDSGEDVPMPYGTVEFGEWSPDSQRFAYPTADNRLLVMERDGAMLRPLENIPNYVPYLGFAWTQCADLVEHQKLVSAQGL